MGPYQKWKNASYTNNGKYREVASQASPSGAASSGSAVAEGGGVHSASSVDVKKSEEDEDGCAEQLSKHTSAGLKDPGDWDAG